MANYWDIVNRVSDPDRVKTFLTWNACSGIAHGDPLATFAAASMMGLPGGNSPKLVRS